MYTLDKISLIIPVYNVGDYLEKCLLSITEQTFLNIEIIIIDDGSTDNSLLIAKAHSTKDHRIKVYSTKNGGVASARNFGLEKVTGNYIGFVDPDDWIDVTMYEKLYSLLKKYNADVASCHLRGCTDREYLEPIRGHVEVEVFNHFETLEKFFSSSYSFNGLNAVMVNKLYKKHLFNNIRFNEEMKKGEDTEMSQLLFFRSNKLVYTDERLYFYFRRPDGLTNQIHSPEVLKNVDQHLLLLFEKKIELTANNPEYNKLRKISINDLLSYNIELYFNKSEYNKTELIKTFKKNYVKYASYCSKEFSILRNIRFLLFYIYNPLYKKIFISNKK